MTASQRTPDAALESWRQSDARARECETKLAHAWKEYDRGNGPVPGEQLFAEVALLGELAHQKLSELLHVMKTEASRPERTLTSVQSAPALTSQSAGCS